VSHPETVQFDLSADENGTYGFTLQGANSSSSNTNNNSDGSAPSSFPIIGYVEPNSAAERCGLMQPGDRIISVNNQSLEGLSLEEARKMIKESGANLRLETEFDVADTIMLTSGVFQVKLVKKNLDLGLTVAYPRYCRTDNYPYISEVKKGSISYRFVLIYFPFV
jgi:C-terminal processing protease CtpA/Prc